MADKKPIADNWPVVSGDYIVGDLENPVAVNILASYNEDIPAVRKNHFKSKHQILDSLWS